MENKIQKNNSPKNVNPQEVTAKINNKNNYYIFYDHKKENFLYSCSHTSIESLIRSTVEQIKDIILHDKKDQSSIECIIQNNKVDINISIELVRSVQFHEKATFVQNAVLQTLKNILEIKPENINVIIYPSKNK